MSLDTGKRCSWGHGANRNELVTLTIHFKKRLNYCNMLFSHEKAQLLLRYRPHFWETSCQLHA